MIDQYFCSINAGAFQTTADLFAADGVLHAPFSDPIQGREAIAAYLAAEARGMYLVPLTGQEQRLAGGDRQYELTGRVQTSLFTVNARWLFHLNAASQICSVRVKLLASLAQLLPLKDQQSSAPTDGGN